MNRTPSDRPDAIDAGLAAHMAHVVFDADDPDGSTICIVEITGDRCTAIVREADSPNASTVILTFDQLAAMAEAVQRRLGRNL